MRVQMKHLRSFQSLIGEKKALALLALFISVQIADATLTAVGIGRFGVEAEANPMLAFAFVVAGPAVSLTVAKGAAVFGALMLYRLQRHALLARLTMLYIGVAIAPWAWALSVA
jgi:hypothetical protein